MFVTATICKYVFGLAKKFGPAHNILGPVKGQGKYVNKFLVWHKKIGPAQNILGPVKGQGIRGLNRRSAKIKSLFFSSCQSVENEFKFECGPIQNQYMLKFGFILMHWHDEKK